MNDVSHGGTEVTALLERRFPENHETLIRFVVFVWFVDKQGSFEPMQKTENTKPKKRTWILETVVILIFVAVVLAIAHPIYLTYKVTRRMKAETMAPLIDEIYRFHQEENRWPDEEQFQTLAHRLDIDIKKENLAISANPENLYMIGRLGGKRYIYYHFITQEKRDSGNRLGWWFCHEGTHYSYEPEDWPVLKNAPEP